MANLNAIFNLCPPVCDVKLLYCQVVRQCEIFAYLQTSRSKTWWIVKCQHVFLLLIGHLGKTFLNSDDSASCGRFAIRSRSFSDWTLSLLLSAKGIVVLAMQSNECMNGRDLKSYRSTSKKVHSKY